MGDALMNLGALRLLRQSYPKAWLALCVDASVADLFRGHPDLDEVMAVDAARLKRNWRHRFKFLASLRKAKFHLALVSNPDKILHLLVFLAGIPVRVGYRRKLGFLLNKTLSDPKAFLGRHEMDRNLDLAALVSDKRWDGLTRLSVDAAATRDVDKMLSEASPGTREIIVIHPGTSNALKRWPMENFATLCQLVSAVRSLENYALAFIGGPEEKEISSGIRRQSGVPAADFTGTLSLKQLAAFLNHGRVKLLVSCDSGPVHIAWILGKPVVALYAQNAPGCDPARWGPRDRSSEIIFKPLLEISPPMVLEAMKKALSKEAKTHAV